MPSTLSGRNIVVCRAASQAGGLVKALQDLGASVQRLPLIEVVPAQDQGQRLHEAVAKLHEFDWVAFTSSNAAHAFLKSLGHRCWPSNTRVGVVGQASANVLLDAGVPVAVVPAKATAAALAAAMSREIGEAVESSVGRPVRVLAPLAQLAGPDLVAGLTRPGVVVTALEAYQTITPRHEPEAFAKAAHADAILLSSSSTVERLARSLKSDPTAALICIGPQTAASVGAMGLRVGVVANPHTEAGLVAATLNLLGS